MQRMSSSTRAVLIGLFGPALQTAGVAWDLLEHAVLAKGEVADLTLRHILLGPTHLVIVVGLLISVVCIPIAVRVALAKPEELEIPLFQPRRRESIPLHREAKEMTQ